MSQHEWRPTAGYVRGVVREIRLAFRGQNLDDSLIDDDEIVARIVYFVMGNPSLRALFIASLWLYVMSLATEKRIVRAINQFSE